MRIEHQDTLHSLHNLRKYKHTTQNEDTMSDALKDRATADENRWIREQEAAQRAKAEKPVEEPKSK